MSPSKEHSNYLLSFENKEDVIKMSKKEFRTSMVTKNCELKQKRDNELHDIKKSFYNMKGEMDTLRKKQMELLKMKSVIQEIKNSLKSIKS